MGLSALADSETLLSDPPLGARRRQVVDRWRGAVVPHRSQGALRAEKAGNELATSHPGDDAGNPR